MHPTGLENGKTQLNDVVIREYLVKKPLPTRQGVAGAQTSADGGMTYAGGGKQVEFLIDTRAKTLDLKTGDSLWRSYLDEVREFGLGDRAQSAKTVVRVPPP